MIVLALEGGGVRGAYQAGAYMAFRVWHQNRWCMWN